MNTYNPEYIAANPNEFGFTFATSPVKTDGRNGMEIGLAALPIVTDITKFIETFGDGLVLRGLNGSNSPRVMAQAIARRKYLKNRSYKLTDLKVDVVKALLAIRAVPYMGGVPSTKFVVVINGEKHTFNSEAEMDEYIADNS